MAAVQDGPKELDVDAKPEIDGTANLSGNPVSGPLSSSPPAGGAPKAEDQQTLLAVLQFLKRNNLSESVDILRREAGLTEVQEDSLVDGASGVKSGEDQPDVSVVLSAYSQQGDPSLYKVYYSNLKSFIESVLDCHRAELSQLFYPLFVHMYLELVYNNHENEAKAFFEKFSGDQECYYEDDLRILCSLTKKEHMKGNEVLLDFRTSRFVLRISRDSYQLLKRHLQERQNNQIWNIIQEHLYIDIFDGMPRSKSQIDSMSGSLAGEGKREVNKVKVFHGLLKEPEIEVPLDDEDEEAENEEGKPKKKKAKKDNIGSKSKKQDPNAPQQNRIPLPELKDSDKLDKIMYMKESTKRIRLGPENLPSICFYTFLNAYQGLTAVDFTDDSSLIAGGFADSTSDDVLERIMDEKTASESKILHGHSGPVYGVSFSPDRNYLLSSSEDGTIRLWSLQTFTCLVGYKGHNYPVWDTQFSPFGYYFISGGHDRVARLWATDHYQPLRIFAGHLADVTCTRFHPNANYVATGSSDRTVRLWDGPIHSLTFSPNGKFLASGSTDGRVLLWDLGHGLMIGELKGHTDTVYALRFSSMDNTVRLWDIVKAIDDVETDDFTATTGHIHLPDNSQELLLGTYHSKSTPVIHLHFTRRNLLLSAGAYNS
ncbi:hypothetical protein DNTS_002548 [Danionella cerebrum]|uniref:Transcription initiation factor TFIID subunit 5 n=1 Tax=Danionella cerebrum TaxID=2873325 RepID=A0A553MSN7_9TELE|nr:hypothetical protein DNTS_002548 [Danionella translucida]